MIKFVYVTIFVCLAGIGLAGCYQTSGYGAGAYASIPPDNQYVPYCYGGYDFCGRDGRLQSQNSSPY
jgi:hypothetical protein